MDKLWISPIVEHVLCWKTFLVQKSGSTSFWLQFFFFFEQQTSLRSEKDLARVASLKARSSHCVNNVLFWAEHPCFSSELPWRSTDAEASIFFPPNAMHPLWTALRWLCSFECDFEITSRLSLSSTIQGKKKARNCYSPAPRASLMYS